MLRQEAQLPSEWKTSCQGALLRAVAPPARSGSGPLSRAAHLLSKTAPGHLTSWVVHAEAHCQGHTCTGSPTAACRAQASLAQSDIHRQASLLVL